VTGCDLCAPFPGWAIHLIRLHRFLRLGGSGNGRHYQPPALKPHLLFQSVVAHQCDLQWSVGHASGFGGDTPGLKPVVCMLRRANPCSTVAYLPAIQCGSAAWPNFTPPNARPLLLTSIDNHRHRSLSSSTHFETEASTPSRTIIRSYTNVAVRTMFSPLVQSPLRANETGFGR